MRKTTLTPDQYLAWENEQTEKHEYVNGEIFAMVGARREHVATAGNIYASLKANLKGGPCRVYMADMKLRVAAAKAFFYPDVVVTCDARDHKADLFLEHPTLIVEVLSDTTAAFDRGEKFASYRQISSLQEYLLVDIDNRRADCFRRDEHGRWVLYDFKDSDTVELTSIAFETPLSVLFEDIEPPVVGENGVNQ